MPELTKYNQHSWKSYKRGSISARWMEENHIVSAHTNIEEKKISKVAFIFNVVGK